MSRKNITIINKYKVFNIFGQDLVENIKIFYIPNENEVFYVTKNDQVFKHQSNEFIKTKYDELCSKHVIKFASSFEHYMALTVTGSVYSWGSNKFGQLGDGSIIDSHRPKLITALLNKHIIDICCGNYHSLVLSDDGCIFAFGFNSYGEIGNFNTVHQLIPYKVSLFSSLKVKIISCGLHHSAALTDNGKVYVWGSNSSGQLGIAITNMKIIPTELKNIPLIKQLVCNTYGTIMLTIDGDIYICGLGSQSSRDKLPQKINKNVKFIEIAASIHSQLCVSLSVINKCYAFYDSKTFLSETKYVSIEETYAKLSKSQITHKSYLLPYIKKNIKFYDQFEQLKLLGRGGFGSVFKVMNRTSGKFFAVKNVCLRIADMRKITNEVNFLSRLNSSFTVKYVDSWIEQNYYIGTFDSEQSSTSSDSLSSGNNLFNPNYPLLLHIQMELCPMSLKQAIVQLKQYIHNSDTTTSFAVCYYIISELFVEIVECVQYLHHQNPPIIHRDLKPDNILLTNFVDHRFVRLADFGLSTEHESLNQSHTKDVGTSRYKAPEVMFQKQYTFKADIYSLGMVFTDLHHTIASETENKKLDSLLNTKAKKSAHNLMNIMRQQQDQRPNCEKILSHKHRWTFTNEEIVNYKEFIGLVEKSPKANSIADNFIEFFVQNKYSYNQRQTPRRNRLMVKLSQ